MRFLFPRLNFYKLEFLGFMENTFNFGRYYNVVKLLSKGFVTPHSYSTLIYTISFHLPLSFLKTSYFHCSERYVVC